MTKHDYQPKKNPFNHQVDMVCVNCGAFQNIEQFGDNECKENDNG